MMYQHIKLPKDGQAITRQHGQLHVPEQPIIPFITDVFSGSLLSTKPMFDIALSH